jgi:hypothetical protein
MKQSPTVRRQCDLPMLGVTVLHDRSQGQGHCWRQDEMPPSIAEEIAAEILDGHRAHCNDYVASNGEHYRW